MFQDLIKGMLIIAGVLVGYIVLFMVCLCVSPLLQAIAEKL